MFVIKRLCLIVSINTEYTDVYMWNSKQQMLIKPLRTSTGFLLPISHNLPAHASAGAATFTDYTVHVHPKLTSSGLSKANGQKLKD